MDVARCRTCGRETAGDDFAVARVDKVTGRKIRRRDCKECWAGHMRERRANVPKPTMQTCIKCRRDKPKREFRQYRTGKQTTECLECSPPRAPRKQKSGVGRHPQSIKPPRVRPKVRDLPKPVSPLELTCPTCNAGPRHPCDTRMGGEHGQRVDRWLRIVREWPYRGRELI